MYTQIEMKHIYICIYIYIHTYIHIYIYIHIKNKTFVSPRAIV